MNIRYILIGMLVFSLLTIGAMADGSYQVAATEPSVTIISPKGDDTVGSKVELKWKLEKANKAAHVHLYIDGKNTGPKQGDSYTIKNLKPGKHTIELHPATASHDEVGANATITVTVK